MLSIKKAIALLGSNKKLFLAAILQRLGGCIPDKPYLHLLFFFRMGYRLNLKEPRSFSEKIQWLKFYYREPYYSSLIDKFEVKQYIVERIGNSYVIPTIGIWDSYEQIEWSELPTKFVLKTTHGGGSAGVIICKDAASFNKQVAQKMISDSLKQNIYKEFREWPYKNITPRIMAEQYMELDDGSPLVDYKFFCFNGKPRFLYVRNPNQKSTLDFITMDWERAGFRRVDCQVSEQVPPKPSCFEEMKTIATTLSSPFPFVRVDLYDINGKVFFSELTFFPSSGLLPFVPEEWDFRLGELLELPIKQSN